MNNLPTLCTLNQSGDAQNSKESIFHIESSNESRAIFATQRTSLSMTRQLHHASIKMRTIRLEAKSSRKKGQHNRLTVHHQTTCKSCSRIFPWRSHCKIDSCIWGRLVEQPGISCTSFLL